MKKKELSIDPEIFIISNFLSISECNSLIESCGNNFTNSTISYSSKKSSYRKSQSSHIETSLRDNIENRICGLFNCKEFLIEKLELTRYLIGGEYNDHFDAFNTLEDSSIPVQRIYSAVIYLNDNFVGGNTYFPRINLTIKPEKGSLLVFKNCIGDSSYVHPNSLHRSEPIKKGTKYIATSWLYKNI